LISCCSWLRYAVLTHIKDPFSFLRRLHSNNAAKSQVTSGSVDRLGHPCRWPIAFTVVWGTQVRPTLHHFARDGNLRGTRVKTLLEFRSTWIDVSATGVGNLVVFLVPVSGPLPNIAC